MCLARSQAKSEVFPCTKITTHLLLQVVFPAEFSPQTYFTLRGLVEITFPSLLRCAVHGESSCPRTSAETKEARRKEEGKRHCQQFKKADARAGPDFSLANTLIPSLTPSLPSRFPSSFFLQISGVTILMSILERKMAEHRRSHLFARESYSKIACN